MKIDLQTLELEINKTERISSLCKAAQWCERFSGLKKKDKIAKYTIIDAT